MAQGRKYAQLPDVDSAPDVYETQQDTQTAKSPTSSHSSSRSSYYQETPQDPNGPVDEDASGIDRATLRPGQARSQFGPARVDAQGVDFSDNVANRRSYKVSSRRRRREFEAFGRRHDDTAQEEDETFDEKLARLKREVEEIKLQQSRRSTSEKEEAIDLVEELSETLIGLEKDGHLQEPTKETESTEPDKEKSHTESQSPSAADLLAHTVPDPAETQRALILAADLEVRMSSLEAALGLPSLSLPNSQNSKPIIPQLQSLDRQLTVLSNTGAASITSLSTQIQSLTQSAEALTTARKQALQARSDLRQHAKSSSQTSFSRPISGQSFSHSRPSSYYGRRPTTGGDDADTSAQPSLDQTAQALLAGEETEQATQIRKLHDQLPTIEALAPLVPGLLERLRSLHVLHADAAGAAENLEAVEKRQSEMTRELEKWRESLDGLEERLREGEGKADANKEAVEKWIRELESKVGQLG